MSKGLKKGSCPALILLGHIWTWSKGHTYEREYGSSLFHTIEKPKWVKVVFIFLGTTDRQILEGGFSFSTYLVHQTEIPR